MNWVIIVVVCLSLIGSVMWVMPSPRDRMQAALRQKAMQLGMQIQSVRLKCPRAIGELEPEERVYMAYRVSRKQPGSNELKPSKTTPWQVFNLNSHATNGLPTGWCWGRGENTLSEAQLDVLAGVIAELPAYSFSVESTPLSVSIYWRENGGLDTVEHIQKLLNSMIESNL